LDGLRGIAIALVVLYHVGFIPAGYAGVDVFFVLSGYLITTLLLRERERLHRVRVAAFYLRRVRRLLPALAVLLPVIIWYALSFDAEGGAGTVFGALTTVTYWTNVAVAQGTAVGLLGHAWSLAVEDQFYLLWPLLVLAIPSRRALGITAISLAVVLALARAGLTLHAGAQVGYFGVRSDEILMGCAAACLNVRATRLLAAACLEAVLFSAVLLPNLNALWPPIPILILPLIALASVCVVTGADHLRVLAIAPLRWLGRISYALYLWHHPVKVAVMRGGLSGVLGGVVTIAVSLCLAEASWRLVERHFTSVAPAYPGEDARPLPERPVVASVPKGGNVVVGDALA
jgi:peptidoglycan/LPS O-acetylase OafA/YrhL